MHAVAETSIFTRRADALLSREDRAALIAVLIYAKNEQDNISADQRRALISIIEAHKAEQRAGRGKAR